MFDHAIVCTVPGLPSLSWALYQKQIENPAPGVLSVPTMERRSSPVPENALIVWVELNKAELSELFMYMTPAPGKGFVEVSYVGVFEAPFVEDKTLLFMDMS